MTNSHFESIEYQLPVTAKSLFLKNWRRTSTKTIFWRHNRQYYTFCSSLELPWIPLLKLSLISRKRSNLLLMLWAKLWVWKLLLLSIRGCWSGGMQGTYPALIDSWSTSHSDGLCHYEEWNVSFRVCVKFINISPCVTSIYICPGGEVGWCVSQHQARPSLVGKQAQCQCNHCVGTVPFQVQLSGWSKSVWWKCM